MPRDQPLLIDTFKGEQKPGRYHALLTAVAVDKGVEPAHNHGAQLAADALLEHLDVTDQPGSVFTGEPGDALMDAYLRFTRDEWHEHAVVRQCVIT